MYFYLYIALSDILHFYGNHQDKLVSNIFNYAILPTRDWFESLKIVSVR